MNHPTKTLLLNVNTIHQPVNGTSKYYETPFEILPRSSAGHQRKKLPNQWIKKTGPGDHKQPPEKIPTTDTPPKRTGRNWKATGLDILDETGTWKWKTNWNEDSVLIGCWSQSRLRMRHMVSKSSTKKSDWQRRWKPLKKNNTTTQTEKKGNEDLSQFFKTVNEWNGYDQPIECLVIFVPKPMESTSLQILHLRGKQCYMQKYGIFAEKTKQHTFTKKLTSANCGKQRVGFWKPNFP